MSEKKTTKKRPTKKSAGRSHNKTYLGIGIIAAILIIALSVALSIKNNGAEQISKTNEPKIEKQILKKAEPKVASKEKKQEYEKRKYPLKFDEDENLSKIFTDPKHKSELALNSKVEPKEQKKIAEVKSEAKKEEIKKEQNDTKNLLANYKNTEPSVIENEQKIEPFYNSKTEQKTELKSQNFEVKVDQNKSTEIEKKEKIKSENTKVEPAKKAENLTTKKIEKTKYEEKNIKKDSLKRYLLRQTLA